MNNYKPLIWIQTIAGDNVWININDIVKISKNGSKYKGDPVTYTLFFRHGSPANILPKTMEVITSIFGANINEYKDFNKDEC
jgi:hypothetical protein